MRKLKLQMQLSADGFFAGPNGELDWLTWNWDDQLKKHVTELTATVDTIIMGRKLAAGFIPHWQNVASNPEDPSFVAARPMVDYPKVVFTKTLDKSEWGNTILAKGDLKEEIQKLRMKAGKDIIVYGGVNFVSSLVQEDLIDELNLFVNPTALSKGQEIFKTRTNLKLLEARTFDCGIVLLRYEPLKNEK